MQSGTKREFSEPNEESGKKEKQNDRSAEISSAMAINKEFVDALGVEVEWSKRHLSEKQTAKARRDAADVILAFMKAHHTGKTSVLHIRHGELSPLVMGVFLKYMPGIRTAIDQKSGIVGVNPTTNDEVDIVVQIIQGLLGTDALPEFVSSVKLCLRGSVFQYRNDDKVIVTLGIISNRTLDCKKENYVQVGGPGDFGEYILITNSKEN